MKEKVSPKGATKAREIAESIRLRAALKQRELSGIDHWVSARSSIIN